MKLALNSLAFAFGCTLPWLLPWLLPLWVLLALAVILIVVAWGLRRGAMILFLAGFGYGHFVASNTHSHQTPDHPQGLDARVMGRVVGIPQRQDQRIRFLLEVDQFEPLGGEAISYSPRLLRLNWYYGETLAPGDMRQFEVRLRRPRGLVNPSQFDYRQWLLAEGIDATGYVRRLLAGEAQPTAGFDRWRAQQSRALLDNPDLQHADLIAALGIGDRAGIDANQWQLFAATGVIHLMVISGLHLGFAAMLGYWCGSWCLRPLIFLRKSWTAQDIGWICAVIMALLYAFCAGFSTPTLRALIMISLLASCRLLRLRISIWTTLCAAFAVVLLVQPLSVLGSGLWMSFGAVAVLVAAFQGRSREGGIRGLVRAQIALFMGFSALPLAFGNPVPIVAPLVNLVAVPTVGMLVVPLILVGLLCGLFSEGIQQFSWWLADFFLGLLGQWLGWLEQLQLPQIYPLDLGLVAFVPLLIAAFSLVTIPLGTRLWPMLLLALAPLYLPRAEPGFLTIDFFDVGQGTAVLVRQPGYALLYDAGPAFSQSFNAGRDILLPVLRKYRSSVRELIVSHGDSDHSGGARVMAESGWVNGRILVGEPLGLSPAEQPCAKPLQWEVGEVNYAFIYPGSDTRANNNNDQSCVLLISFGDRHILLPGDISRSVEQQLVRTGALPDSVDLLMVPHHGSATSSSAAFINAIKPGVAVVSAGYGNAFGHPVDAVLEGYQGAGSRIFNTATDGAIRVRWNSPEAEAEISLARDANRLWWQE